MEAFAKQPPEVRTVFAKQLAEVKTLDTKGRFKKSLDKLEEEYQFTLLRSLDLFHKEMSRSNLPERLHSIKERLCDTDQDYPAYPTNRPFTCLNLNIKRCRECQRETLRPRPFSNELCCEKCGLLEPLEGVAFDHSEVYSYGDYKVVKRRRTNRHYNFRYYLEKHLRICTQKGHNLSSDTIQRANEAFQVIEQHLPERISMSFVAYKILKEIVSQGPEQYILKYFWWQVPQGSLWKHEEKWQNMLRKFDAV